jgi:hypothetical protein|tara:strand:+ start:11253 stop:12140 length:888 start_codon:yes stop_codon:yes gene_type:complete
MMPKPNVLIEFDKAGAEWVCVAYLTGDGNMLDVVTSGKSPHTITGMLISGAPEELVEKENKIVKNHTDPNTIEELRREHIPEIFDAAEFLPRVMSIRQAGKKSNHGLNYDMKYRRFALENELEEAEAKRMVDLYKKKAYPGLKVWHESIVTDLRETRTLTNCFGRARHFMDAWGPELFDAAYAFKPQSTVFDICRLGMTKTYYSSDSLCEPAELLGHIHDSNVYQYPTASLERLAAFCDLTANDYMNPRCEYNGREFWIDTTMKMGYDMGDMIDFEPTYESVRQTLEQLDEKAAS